MKRRHRYLSLSFGAFAMALGVAACQGVDPDAEFAAAAASFTAGNYSEASIRLRNVVQAQPDNRDARRLRGELALRLGDYQEAVRELERAQSLGMPLESIASQLAEALTAQGQTERALAILDAVHDELANDPRYWTTRAEVLIDAERVAAAEQALDRADRATVGIRVDLVRSRIAYARNDFETAERLLSEALAESVEEPRVLMARAELYARTDRLALAAADLERAADLYGAASLWAREVDALLALVQVQLARNDLGAAEAVAARLSELAPQAAVSAYMLGLIEYRRGRFDEAAALVEPLVNTSPESVQFRSLLGAIHLARGNFGQAEQQLRMVLARAPGDPAAVKLLAETQLRQRRPQAALTTLRAVADAAAEDSQIGLLSGLANLLAGDPAEGLLHLEQAASLDPANELLKLQLARAYLIVGRDADASALLENMLAGEPTALEAGLLKLFTDVRRGAADDEGAAAAVELLEQHSGDARALTGVAIYHQLLGDNVRARELFEQAAALETSGATARLTLAAVLVQAGRHEEAEKLLTQVLDQQPENTRVLSSLAELMTARGAYDDAAELLARATQLADSVAPRIALAQLHLRRQDLGAARLELDAAAAMDPGNPEIVAVEGLLALAEGRLDEAAASLREAEEKLPNRLGVTLALARAELARGRPDDARTVVRRALDVAPASLTLRFVLGQAELGLGNAAEALSIASALKAEYPASSAGYLLEADASSAARRYGVAADSLREAFERDPTWPVMTRWLSALQLAGRGDDALRAAARWAEENPRHGPGALMLADLLREAGRSEASLRAYERALTLDADNLVALNNAAWVAHELRQAEALTYAERAYRIAPENAAVRDTLGWILLGHNRNAEALEHLSRAAELRPGVPEIRYHLGAALAANGRSAEARAALEALLRSEAAFPHRAEAEQLLESL